jgi:hypothetical protein
MGYLNFFKEKWNDWDTFIVILVLLIEVLPTENQPHNMKIILKLFRIFRIATLVKLFNQNGKTKTDHHSMYSKLR